MNRPPGSSEAGPGKAAAPAPTSRRSDRAWVAAAFALLAAMGAGAFYFGRSGERDYFPLQAGRSWVYTMHVDVHGADPETFKSVAVNLTQERVEGTRATPRLYHDGRVRYYRRERGGVTRPRSLAWRAIRARPRGAPGSGSRPGQWRRRARR